MRFAKFGQKVSQKSLVAACSGMSRQVRGECLMSRSPKAIASLGFTMLCTFNVGAEHNFSATALLGSAGQWYLSQRCKIWSNVGLDRVLMVS